jgi:hypothetical protein
MSHKASLACAGAFAAVATLAGIGPACAHELRLLPLNPAIGGPLKISLLVGFHVEPAFEDSFNAVDVILSTFDGALSGSQYGRFYRLAYRCRWNRGRERPRYGQIKGRRALSSESRASHRTIWQHRSRGNRGETDHYRSVAAE